MTAEVCVMNSLAIAMAADSAVTLGSSKIYTSAEKLFALSNHDPVGIMVYGNASFLRIPWETIIKAFRREQGAQSYDHLSTYVNKFILFLKDNPVLFPEAVQKRCGQELIFSFMSYLRDRLENDINEILREEQVIEDSRIRTVLDKIVADESKETSGCELLDDLPENIVDLVITEYKADFDKIRKTLFGTIPGVAENSDLERLIASVIVRQRYGPMLSGVVIAGFGLNEYYPSLVDLVIEGKLCGHLLYHQNNSASVNADRQAYVVPFAQSEMVHMFMQGVDPQLNALLKRYTREILQGTASTVLNTINPDDERRENVEAGIIDAVEDLYKELFKRFEEEQHKLYVEPIMDVVAALPKDELAAMAESLVNLTKFKRRVSMQHETVGGPIDVAVISKGDGFVWIRRKHYFESEFNQRFVAKYYQS